MLDDSTTPALPSSPALSDATATRDRTARRRRKNHRILGATVAVGACLGLIMSLGTAAVAPSAAAIAERATASAAAFTEPRNAQHVLAQAQAALDEATAVAAEVQSSGLDLGVDAVVPDTAGLQRAMEAVSALVEPGDDAALAALPASAAALSTRITTIAAQTDSLRGAFQTAAAAEAEQQAAAAALAAANTPEGAKATARAVAADQYGWGDGQFECLLSLWTKESGWNYQAYNDSSGATGIPQSLPGDKMATFGDDWQTSATTQILWGLDYISRVYGTPCSAWSHSQATDWY